jgi:hypothetical protein
MNIKNIFLLLIIVFIADIAPARATDLYQPQWSNQFGTTSSDYIHGINIKNGKLYISGNTNGSLDGPNAGGGDAFVRKYDTSGNLEWKRQFGTNSGDTSDGLTVDNAGNVYVCGTTTGSSWGSNAGSCDFYLRKYDSLGNAMWTQQYGTAYPDFVGNVANDSQGNIYITGYIQGDFGGDSGTTFWFDSYLAKYNSAGKRLSYSRFHNDQYLQTFYDIAIDKNGSIYACGEKSTNAGSNAYIVKYNSSGTQLWSQTFGPNSTRCHSINVDSLGNVYTTGITNGSLDGQNAGYSDVFIRKYNSSGSLVWGNQIGTSDTEWSNSIEIDTTGKVYVSGYTYGDLGGFNKGIRDPFIAKFDSMGSLLLTQQFGTVEDDGLFISVDGPGNIYCGGGSKGNFAGPNIGDYDAVIMKLSIIPEPSVLTYLTSLFTCFLSLTIFRKLKRGL